MIRPRGRRLALVAVVVSLLVWAASSEAGVGFAVSPSNFRLKKPAGESVSGKVRLYNKGTYPVVVSTEVADIVSVKGEDGFSIRDEAPAGTTPHSAAKWIQMPQDWENVVPPGETITVQFVVSPPPEIASGGYGAYLFFIAKPATAPEAQESDRPEVRLVTIPRLGVAVIYEVEGSVRRDGEVTSLDLTPPKGTQPLKIRHEFRNTGNTEVILTGSFHILDTRGLMVGKGSLKTLKSFPGESGVTESTWNQKLPKGRYTALITLEIGPDADKAVVRELEFEVL